MNPVEDSKNRILNTYIEKTPKSRAYSENASLYLPGGDTRTMAYFMPYPFVAAFANGYMMTDIDGNEYIDYSNNFTAMIHGHAHPEIVKAVSDQAARGMAHGTPVMQQMELSKLLCERIPDIESVRYCNSASEATLYAMRAARLFTKKDGFIVIDGGYNGCHDFVEVNVTPDYMAEGMPEAKAEPGVSDCVLQDVFVAPFNDLEAIEVVIQQNKDRVAAIIMEPFLCAGGNICPLPGYLQGVRDLCDKYGILLIFDETVTLRFHPGGWHAMENVRCDIMAAGKIVGGGLPVGVFGGRSDIMEIFDPSKDGSVSHSGTFSGNALTMAAGLASMQLLTKEKIDHINCLGDRLRAGITKTFLDAKLQGRAVGFGSLVGISLSGKNATNSKDFVLCTAPYGIALAFLHLAMVNRGINYVGRGMMAISTPMDEALIDRTIAVFAEALEEVLPILTDI